MQSFRLNTLDSFRCKGSDCSFTCCQSWSIEVEAEKLVMWEALEPGPFKERLLAAIERNDSSGNESVLMRLGADRRCVMLDDTGLCSVHQRSEALLAAICRDYPRITRQSGARKLVSAKMSCPEVVRLVLAAGTDNPFHVTNDPERPDAMGADFVTQVGQALEGFVNQVLAERRFPLAIRIGGIADVLVRLALLSQQGRTGLREVQQLCARPRQQLYDFNQKSRLRHFRAQPAVAGRFWKLVFSFLAAADAEAYFDPAITRSELAQRARSAQSDADYEALYQDVMAYRDKAVFELSEPNRLYGEKYLRVKFINSGFPAVPIEGNFIASFLFCVYPYALVQLCLWLLAAHNGTVGDADVLSVISRVERMLDHNDRIYRFLDQSEGVCKLNCVTAF
ncbi:MAG: flagellin lysine-N-methylase [Thiobacillus sp.]